MCMTVFALKYLKSTMVGFKALYNFTVIQYWN